MSKFQGAGTILMSIKLAINQLQSACHPVSRAFPSFVQTFKQLVPIITLADNGWNTGKDSCAERHATNRPALS
jgi:hypothetical protein